MATAWEQERDKMVQAFRKGTWTWRKWTRQPALVAKDGSQIQFYHGQTYDAEKFDLVPDGWDHDHCELCFKTIRDFVWEDAKAPVVDEGYINEDECWLCCDCFQKYLGGPREAER